MARKSTAKIDDVLAARRQEVETTLAEMIELIEQYFTVTPFDFLEGTEGEATYLLFSKENKSPFTRFQPWADAWISKLFPRIVETERKLEKQSDFTDETSELAYDSQRFGFVLGVLVGMANMGASKDELLQKSQGFVIPERLIISAGAWNRTQRRNKHRNHRAALAWAGAAPLLSSYVI